MAHPSKLSLGPCNTPCLVLRHPSWQLPPAAPACRLRSCRQPSLSVSVKPTEGLAVTEAEQAGVPASSTQAAWSTQLHPAPTQAPHGPAALQQQPVQGISTAGAAQDPAVRARLWKAAIKLPIYSVAYIPVLVAGALVFHQLGVVAPMAQLAGYVVASIMIVAWLNLSNDAFDAQTGVDQSKPESVVNLTGNHTLVAALAVAFFVAGTGLLAALLRGAGDMRPAALMAFSIACGYVYQGPPFRLSYKGLGEPLCFMAVGPSVTTAFYLAMSQLAAAPAAAAAAGAATSLPFPLASIVSGVPASVWWCSVLVGLTTTIILFTSHFHQIEGDRAAGKLSPLVRLGAARGLKVLQASVASVYVLAAAAVLLGALPVAVLPVLCCSLPAARELLAYAVQHHLVPARIAILKRFTCFWHIAFGCSLTAGLVLPRLLPALMP